MRNGKEAIATVLGCDINDVEKYQNEKGVYYVGDVYYCSLPLGKERLLPTGYVWEPMSTDWFTNEHKIKVYRSPIEEVKPKKRRIEYYEGVYEITPLGPKTTFQCYVTQKGPDEYVLIDLITNESLDVSYDLLSRMRPQFIRKHEPKA